jgi:hypothetical protein
VTHHNTPYRSWTSHTQLLVSIHLNTNKDNPLFPCHISVDKGTETGLVYSQSELILFKDMVDLRICGKHGTKTRGVDTNGHTDYEKCVVKKWTTPRWILSVTSCLVI